jgi:hypothetical protein
MNTMFGRCPVGGVGAGRTRTNHEQGVGFVYRGCASFEKGVANSLFITGISIECQKRLFHPAVDNRVAFEIGRLFTNRLCLAQTLGGTLGRPALHEFDGGGGLVGRVLFGHGGGIGRRYAARNGGRAAPGRPLDTAPGDRKSSGARRDSLLELFGRQPAGWDTLSGNARICRVFAGRFFVPSGAESRRVGR